MNEIASEKSDVIILGGGLVGLTLAIALDRNGISSVVIDPANPDAVVAPGFDGRVSAVASASWRMLEVIGVGRHLEGQGCPIREIRVSDGLKPGILDFRPEEEEGPLGIMFENRLLREALRAASLEAKNIRLRMPNRAVDVVRDASGVTATLDSGEVVKGALLIAAEGRRSPTREAAGLNVARWDYHHVAIISAFEHEVPHDNVAYEIFYPAGPFALLPMLPGNRSALVWTVSAKDAPGMLKLSDRGFWAEAEKQMGGFLGKLTPVAPRQSYPLNFHHAAHITDERLVLVGDAAHGIHPIAGQGLNLGFRDVAALAEVLTEGVRIGLDCGDAQLLARYERWRGLDTFMVATATDTLTRLFGIPGDAASAVRRFGLGMVQRIPPLKRSFMAEARGESGALPKLLQGMPI